MLTLAEPGARGPLLDLPRELVGVEERVRARHLHAPHQARDQRPRGLLRAPDAAHLAHAARDGAARAGGGRLPGRATARGRPSGPTCARRSPTRPTPPLLGDLESARYGLACAEEAYRRDARRDRPGGRVSAVAAAAPGLLAGLRPPPGRDAAPAFDGGWRRRRRRRRGALPLLPRRRRRGLVGRPRGAARRVEPGAPDRRAHPRDGRRRAARRGPGRPPVAGRRGLQLRPPAGRPAGRVARARRWPASTPRRRPARRPRRRARRRPLPRQRHRPAASPTATADALVALNLLEHLPDDGAALAEFARVLRPGGRAVVVVPANPRLYDYYDAHLRHERRYARRRAGRPGPGRRACAGGAARPSAAWSTRPSGLVKTRNRRRRLGPRRGRARAWSATSPARRRSPLARAAFRLEAALLRRGAPAPARHPPGPRAGAPGVTAYLVTGGAGLHRQPRHAAPGRRPGGADHGLRQPHLGPPRAPRRRRSTTAACAS